MRGVETVSLSGLSGHVRGEINCPDMRKTLSAKHRRGLSGLSGQISTPNVCARPRV
jgi:hypothetical protein